MLREIRSPHKDAMAIQRCEANGREKGPHDLMGGFRSLAGKPPQVYLCPLEM